MYDLGNDSSEKFILRIQWHRARSEIHPVQFFFQMITHNNRNDMFMFVFVLFIFGNGTE